MATPQEETGKELLLTSDPSAISLCVAGHWRLPKGHLSRARVPVPDSRLQPPSCGLPVIFKPFPGEKAVLPRFSSEG